MRERMTDREEDRQTEIHRARGQRGKKRQRDR